MALAHDAPADTTEVGEGVIGAGAHSHADGVQDHIEFESLGVEALYSVLPVMRQLDFRVTREMEDALLRTIARTDGTPFPAMATLASRWLRGRLRQPALVESTYCAEVVAGSYHAMGLLAGDRPTNYYDPGKFWSGDALQLVGGARLGDEIRVDVPVPIRQQTPQAETG